MDGANVLGGRAAVFPSEGQHGRATAAYARMKMEPEALKRRLCETFCGSIDVRPVPSGLAISSAFEDQSGDAISFYLAELEDGFQIEDDGAYLSHLIAKDIPIDQGARGQLLDAILEQGHAHWDRETLEIRSSTFPESEISRRVVDFMSSLMRVRDLELITREVVRSTFREDATKEIHSRFKLIAVFSEDEPVNSSFSDFPADLVVKPLDDAPPDARPGAIYFVNSSDKLNEALLLHYEADKLNRRDFEIIALIEEPAMRMISHRKFQRAQNRSLTMPIFRGDEEGAISMIGRRLNLDAFEGQRKG
jgi:hypothetical protein